jgi:hypothetical protein
VVLEKGKTTLKLVFFLNLFWLHFLLRVLGGCTANFGQALTVQEGLEENQVFECRARVSPLIFNLFHARHSLYSFTAAVLWKIFDFGFKSKIFCLIDSLVLPLRKIALVGKRPLSNLEA